MACFIDLFAGCGGLSLGLMQSGWRGLFAIEKEQNAFSTLQHNLLDQNMHHCFDWPDWLPQKTHSVESTIKNYREQLNQLSGNVDMVVGGPPCQGYSTAGRRKPDDPRNSLYHSYLNFVDIIKPKIVLFENVLGIKANFKIKESQSTKNYASDLIQALSKDYDVYSEILNAEDFGVAQSRRRFFVIAIRRKKRGEECNENPFDRLSGSIPQWLAKKGIKRLPVSVRRAISDFEVSYAGEQPSQETPGFQEIGFAKPRTPYQAMLHKGRRGHSGNLRLAKHASCLLKRFGQMIQYSEIHGCKGRNIASAFFLAKGMKKTSIRVLNEGQPAPTITSRPDDLIHYSEPRILTVRETARLQGFPDWFEFCGKYTTGGLQRRIEVPRFTQVANAVPPMMAESIGLTLLAEIQSS